MNEQTELHKFDDALIFDLPGYGQKKENCGDPVYLAHLAPDGHKVHWVKRTRSCHRKECPVCWKDWQKREALAIQDRIATYYQLNHRMPVHYVLSPPQSVVYDTKTTFRRLRKMAYEVGKQRGIRGGCIIFHERALRYSEDKEAEYVKAAHCSNGPHFHIIGDGWLNERIKEFFLKDGWIVKNLRVRKLSQVYSTAYYILDHASIAHGYPANSQSRSSELASITWFGTMSYNKMPKQKFTGSDTIYCPICKSEIDRSEWFKGGWLGDLPPPDVMFGEAPQGENGFIIDGPLTGWSGFYE